MTTSRICFLILAAALVVPAMPQSAVGGETAGESGETCRGLPATIVGSQDQRELAGTPGADVIVTNGSQIIEPGAGDDVVCTTASLERPETGIIPNYRVDGAAGDDVVDLTDNLPGVEFQVRAGAGRDSVYGGPGKEFIGDDGGDGTADMYSAGGGDDFVGSDSGSDVIDLGPGRDTFSPGYEVSEQVAVRGGGGTDTIYMPKFGRHGSPWVFDNRREVIERGHSAFVTFDEFESFNAYGDRRASLSFVGSDQGDYLSVSSMTNLGKVVMGGGDDGFYYHSAPNAPLRFEGGLHGGLGRDIFFATDPDAGVVLDLRRERLQLTAGDYDPANPMTGFEDALVIGQHVVLIGGDGANRLRWWGCSGKVRGGRGDDQIAWIDNDGGSCRGQARLRARGDRGDDLPLGGPLNDVLIGGPGSDTARGSYGRDSCEAEVQVSCR